MSALVSVIIPAYNAATMIGRTLASASAQTWRDLEILVVDDGSSDATPDIVRNAQAKDPRIVLLRQPNAGVAAARNHGLARSRGDLIAPLDADDLWHPEKLARQVARLGQAGAGAVMAYCWSRDIDADDLADPAPPACDRFEGDIFAALVHANFIGNGSVPLIRRETLIDLGGWDPGLRAAQAQGCEDWQVHLAAAERGDVVLAPGFLVGYRQSPGAMSRNFAAMRRSYDIVLSRAQAAHPELPGTLFSRSMEEFETYAMDLLLTACRDSGMPLMERVAMRHPAMARALLRYANRPWWRWAIAIGGASRPMIGSSKIPFASCAADPVEPPPESFGAALAAEVGALRIDRDRRMPDWRSLAGDAAIAQSPPPR